MKKLLALFLALLLLVSLLAGCNKKDGNSTDQPADNGKEIALTDPALTAAAPTADNARVFYEIFVGSFSDSNGDGIGDLRGIINRMDYLNDGNDNSGRSLGVEGLWLTPIFDSGSYHKYDVNDYYTVDPDFGTTEDLKELLTICHERNVKVILDLPINHTSRGCEWFKSFQNAHKNKDTSDPYYEFYSYYSKGESAPAGRKFAALSGTDEYYECNFDGGMPELNFDSPDVRQAVLDVAKYYLDLGVDGFRFDAAKYVYFGDHKNSVDFWVWYMDQLRAINPEIYVVAEVWDGDGVTDMYYPAMNCFNFTMSQSNGLIAEIAQKGDVNRYTNYVQSYLRSIAWTNPDAMILPFIANHDNDRAAGFLPTLNGYAQMAANLMILGPGSPFIYYGEELGMRGSRGSANTDANRRLAMVWGDEDTVKDPTGATYAQDNRADATAKEQLLQESSLYTYYKKLIMIRKANPEIARGNYAALTVPDSKVGGFVSAWNGKAVCVLHNTTGKDVTLELKDLKLADFAELKSSIGLGTASLDGTKLTLGAQTSVVLRAESEPDWMPAPPESRETEPKTDVPDSEPVVVEGWSVIGTLYGSNWDKDFLMTEVEPGVYELECKGLHMNEEYKVRKDGDWAVNFGSDGNRDGPNAIVPESGDYLVRLTVAEDESSAVLELLPLGD